MLSVIYAECQKKPFIVNIIKQNLFQPIVILQCHSANVILGNVIQLNAVIINIILFNLTLLNGSLLIVILPNVTAPGKVLIK